MSHICYTFSHNKNKKLNYCSRMFIVLLTLLSDPCKNENQQRQRLFMPNKPSGDQKKEWTNASAVRSE